MTKGIVIVTDCTITAGHTRRVMPSPNIKIIAEDVSTGIAANNSLRWTAVYKTEHLIGIVYDWKHLNVDRPRKISISFQITSYMSPIAMA